MRTIKEIDSDIEKTRYEIEHVEGTQTEVYARIVGYYRAVRNWNKGKKEEFGERKVFDVDDKQSGDAMVSDAIKKVDNFEGDEVKIERDAESAEAKTSHADDVIDPLDELMDGADLCPTCADSYKKIEKNDDAGATLDEKVDKNSDNRDWVMGEYKKIADTFFAMVFSKKTCPNCPPVLEWLKIAPIEKKYIDVSTTDGLMIAARNGVFSTPTVIFFNGKKELGRAHSVDDLDEIFKSVRG